MNTSISVAWLLLANSSVLGMLVYNACFKLAGKNIEAFTFTFILGCVQILVLLAGMLVAKYIFKTDLIGGVRPREAWLAVGAGFAVVVIDVTLFLAYRHGSAVITNTYTSIAQISLFTVLAFFLFHETVSLTKGLGVALGLASIVLLAL